MSDVKEELVQLILQMNAKQFAMFIESLKEERILDDQTVNRLAAVMQRKG